MNALKKAQSITFTNLHIPKRYVHEIDILRASTAISVVGVHAMGYTVFLNATFYGQAIESFLFHLLQFNREIFMLISAFVLVYIYYNKHLSIIEFWTKRMLVIFLPYVIWSFVYVRVNQRDLNLQKYITTSLYDILIGNASFQLYYVVLILQFYLFFPFLLTLFKKVVSHPWIVLSISFILQLIIFYLEFTFLEVKQPSHPSLLLNLLIQLHGRIFLSFQFYFVLGAYAAIYFGKVKSFLLTYGKIFIPLYLVGFAIFTIGFYKEVFVDNISLTTATSVLQPLMLLYTISVILLLAYGILSIGKKYGEEGRSKPYKLFHILTELAFGIYLLQGFFLNLGRRILLLFQWPHTMLPLATILLFLFTLLGSIALSFFFLCTPVLHYLIGKTEYYKLNYRDLFYKKESIHNF